MWSDAFSKPSRNLAAPLQPEPPAPAGAPALRAAEIFRRPWLWPRYLALGFVRGYQRGISPWLPAVFGAGAGCRFYPTCSHYAAEALQRHGFLAGLYLAARRLLRCQPLHPGGVDLVPENFRWLPPAERRFTLFPPARVRRVTPHHG